MRHDHAQAAVERQHLAQGRDRLRQAAAKKNRVVRIVDQKTAVAPLHADTLGDPNKLLASVRSLLDLPAH